MLSLLRPLPRKTACAAFLETNLEEKRASTAADPACRYRIKSHDFQAQGASLGWVGCRCGLRLAGWPPVSLKEYTNLRTRGCERRFSLFLHSQHKRPPGVSRRRPLKSRPEGQRISASDKSAILFGPHIVIRRCICPVQTAMDRLCRG